MLYHEATYGDEFAALAKETFHSTAGQAARLAQLAGVKHLLLGHFSSRYKDDTLLLDEARAIFADTELAEEKTTYEIPVVKNA